MVMVRSELDQHKLSRKQNRITEHMNGWTTRMSISPYTYLTQYPGRGEACSEGNLGSIARHAASPHVLSQNQAGAAGRRILGKARNAVAPRSVLPNLTAACLVTFTAQFSCSQVFSFGVCSFENLLFTPLPAAYCLRHPPQSRSAPPLRDRPRTHSTSAPPSTPPDNTAKMMKIWSMVSEIVGLLGRPCSRLFGVVRLADSPDRRNSSSKMRLLLRRRAKRRRSHLHRSARKKVRPRHLLPSCHVLRIC